MPIWFRVKGRNKMLKRSKAKIVGIGGTVRSNSTSEKALRYAARLAEARGVECRLFTGQDLIFPLYGTSPAHAVPKALEFVEAVRNCDALLVSSPGYHGGTSGLIKNAFDYLEELRNDARPYLDGRAVGCITCAYGSQAMVSTLQSLRVVCHSLRAWPTPYGATLDSLREPFNSSGTPVDDTVRQGIDLVVSQIVQFLGRGNGYVRMDEDSNETSPVG
jgi:FMN reductase